MRRRLSASSSRTIAGRSSPDHQTLIAIVISAVVPTHRPSRWITTKITPRPSGATLGGRASSLLANAAETGEDPAANDLPLLLADHRRHLDHGSPIGVVLSIAC